MVERVPWMTPADYEILLFFDEHDIRVSPKVLAVNLEYHRHYVGKRCGILTEAGLLENDGSGLYWLSEDGYRYLEGTLDVDELNDVE